MNAGKDFQRICSGRIYISIFSGEKSAESTHYSEKFNSSFLRGGGSIQKSNGISDGKLSCL